MRTDKLKPRYFVEKPGRGGQPRYFWQPSKALRAAGWEAQRLAEQASPETAKGHAINQADAFNDKVDAWREGMEIPSLAPLTIGPAAGSVSALIDAYKDTRRYTRLKPRSKEQYNRALEMIREWAGDKPARAITAGMVDNFYEGLFERTPAMANVVLSVMGRLFSTGLRLGLVDFNPAKDPDRIGLEMTGVIWPRQAVTVFTETADAMDLFTMGTMIACNEWFGANPIDLYSWPRALYRDGVIRFERVKTDGPASLPVDMVDALTHRLEKQFARYDAAGVRPMMLFARDGEWRPYSKASFGREFRSVRDAVAADHPEFVVDSEDGETVTTADLKFRFLRHTAVTRLAEAGATSLQISGITGHSPGSIDRIIRHYLVKTTELARGAFAKRLENEIGTA